LGEGVEEGAFAAAYVEDLDNERGEDNERW